MGEQIILLKTPGTYNKYTEIPQGIIKNQYEPAFYLQGSPCRKSIFHLLSFCISRAIALVLLLNGTFSGTSRHITGVFWVFRSHSGVSRWVACVYFLLRPPRFGTCQVTNFDFFLCKTSNIYVRSFTQSYAGLYWLQFCFFFCLFTSNIEITFIEITFKWEVVCWIACFEGSSLNNGKILSINKE